MRKRREPVFTAEFLESQSLEEIAMVLNHAWYDLASLEQRCETAEQNQCTEMTLETLSILSTRQRRANERI